MQQHAAQAPVRPRHCTQALLQQPDQVIHLALPSSASRALLIGVCLRRLLRLSLLRASTSRRGRQRRCEGTGHIYAGPEMCGNRARRPVMSAPSPPLFALPFDGVWAGCTLKGTSLPCFFLPLPTCTFYRVRNNELAVTKFRLLSIIYGFFQGVDRRYLWIEDLIKNTLVMLEQYNNHIAVDSRSLCYY